MRWLAGREWWNIQKSLWKYQGITGNVLNKFSGQRKMIADGMVRTAGIGDAAAILDIYSHYVENTTITFEIVPPALKEMEKRIGDGIKLSNWLVYELDKKVVGYAYYSKFRERKAYDFSCETTVYVHKNYVGKGIGSGLYKKLIENLRQTQMAVAIGAIALPNQASVKLHEKMGFKNAGILKNVGRKFNTWIDVGYWALELKNLTEYRPEKQDI
jgi:L-amino acid N-acyltransferase YncA